MIPLKGEMFNTLSSKGLSWSGTDVLQFGLQCLVQLVYARGIRLADRSRPLEVLGCLSRE
jgi:hypothetical protein